LLRTKLKKRRELGITDSLGVGLVAFCQPVQVGQNLFWGDLLDGSITEFMDKPFDDGPVIEASTRSPARLDCT